MDDLATAFVASHPGVSIEIATGGSDSLARSILDGAPADVFASADERQLQRVEEAGLVWQAGLMATNGLAIAVAEGNPFHIDELEDLVDPRIVVVIGAPGVPLGEYTRQALAESGVDLAPASLESDARSVLTKIQLGEADAAIVYRTDARGAVSDVEAIPITTVEARYPIAVLRDAPAVATEFHAFVLSPAGAEVLRRHGFGSP